MQTVRLEIEQTSATGASDFSGKRNRSLAMKPQTVRVVKFSVRRVQDIIPLYQGGMLL